MIEVIEAGLTSAWQEHEPCRASLSALEASGIAPPASAQEPTCALAANSPQEEVIERLVKKECQARNSCTLDLKWPQMTPSPVIQPTNSSSLSPATGSGKSNSLELARQLAEVCQNKRKWLNLVYRCRPNKLSRRYVCRGNTLQLECPPDRRLVVVAADFGWQRDEVKVNERCSTPELAPGSGQQAPASAAQEKQPRSSSCWTNASHALQVNCAGQRYCELEVSPSSLGVQSSCSADKPEYLRTIFVCALQELVEGAFVNRTRSSVESAPVSVDSVRVVIEQQGLSSKPVGLWAALDKVRFLLAHHQAALGYVSLGVLAVLLVGVAWRLCGRAGSARVPKRTGSSQASSGSCSSDCSSGSSAGFLMGASTNSSSAKPGRHQSSHHLHHHQQQHLQQHNSCSESHFSLDEGYHLGALSDPASQPHLNQGAHSPTLLSSRTDTLDNNSPSSPLEYTSQASFNRSRLWTTYGRHEQAPKVGRQHSLRAPNRTFVAQPQLPAGYQVLGSGAAQIQPELPLAPHQFQPQQQYVPTKWAVPDGQLGGLASDAQYQLQGQFGQFVCPAPTSSAAEACQFGASFGQ